MKAKSYLDVLKINYLIFFFLFLLVTFVLEPDLFQTLARKLNNVGFGRLVYSAILSILPAIFISFFNKGETLVFQNNNKNDFLKKIKKQLNNSGYVLTDESDSMITYKPSWKKAFNLHGSIDTVYVILTQNDIKVIGPVNFLKRKLKTISDKLMA